MSQKLMEISKHWEIVVEVGNDWGNPSYTESRIFENIDEVHNALENFDYYTCAMSVKDVVEYDII